VGDDTFAFGLYTAVLADVGRSHDGHDGVAREVDGLGAGLIWFPGTGAGATHGYQFSLITHAAGAVTRRLLASPARSSGNYQQYWLRADVRGGAANR
jgi:hypothetical protein